MTDYLVIVGILDFIVHIILFCNQSEVEFVSLNEKYG